MEIFRSYKMGWFVLKEKLKLIKAALKDLHVSHTHNLSGKFASLKDRQAALDGRAKEDLSEEKLADLHGILFDIHSLSRLNTSICWLQSRLTWIREGDANSKYFHYVLASRCNTPIFNISLLVLLLYDINFDSIDLFDIINLIIRIY